LSRFADQDVDFACASETEVVAANLPSKTRVLVLGNA
jgi:hypothetical protein